MTKTIFITGAAAGIGLATAKLFAANGWKVGAADRDGRLDVLHAVRALMKRLWQAK